RRASLLRPTRRRLPKRTDLRSILILGSGPIRIGQACEFDYSGAQACRVLRREGYRVVLVNSNPATIMTDPEWADATYLEPLDAATVAEVIEHERPDAILPTRSEEHTSELQSLTNIVCRLLLEKKTSIDYNEVQMVF